MAGFFSSPKDTSIVRPSQPGRSFLSLGQDLACGVSHRRDFGILADFDLVNERAFAGCADKSDMSPLDNQSRLLARLMDGASLRHQVVSHNLANLNTPGYRRLEVDFETQLTQLIGKAGSSGEVPDVSPVVKETEGASARLDGNTVDLDREVGELQRNSMLFQTYTQLLQARIGLMRRAMEGH
jgi:flagellar basal-body rod protein FlgB